MAYNSRLLLTIMGKSRQELKASYPIKSRERKSGPMLVHWPVCCLCSASFLHTDSSGPRSEVMLPTFGMSLSTLSNKQYNPPILARRPSLF